MAEYKNEEPCEFIYHITAIEKVVDGDTVDAIIDLGFDVRFCGRIRLLGMDTPESVSYTHLTLPTILRV